MTLLERYQNGEYKVVWAEMVADTDRFGNPIRDTDVEAVAEETMRRVRHNIETIVERLTATGYEFGVFPDGEPVNDPLPVMGNTEAVAENIHAVKELVGEMPCSLRMFYQHVGSVCLVGRYPDAEPWDDADPLWVNALDLEAVREAFEEWQIDQEEYGEDETGPFGLELAPDYFHKDNTGGGEAYTVELPCGDADAPLLYEWHRTTFVDYLRICFEWGGFPGFAREWDKDRWVPENKLWRPAPVVPPQIALLREGLLPI